ncbi:MAG: SH3 domain-containing protein, partial [Pseudomonadota bacterium]
RAPIGQPHLKPGIAVHILLGGKVRSGPGMHYHQVGSTYEGQQLTVLHNTQQYMNGYPWFQVRLANGRTGYQWGGLMCGYGAPRQGMYKICR